MPPLKTFVLEDDAIVRCLLRRVIESTAGLCLLQEALDVPQAVAALQEDSPAIAVLDLDLPSGTGLEVLRLIRRTIPDCRVIIFSAGLTPEKAARCRQAGADYCYSKGVEAHLLVKKLRQLAEEARHQ